MSSSCPGVPRAPGFEAAYWTIKGNSGLTMIIFESEDAASGMVEHVRSGGLGAVTLEDVAVHEVVAHA